MALRVAEVGGVMAKHMLRVVETTSYYNDRFVKLQCEHCPKNILLNRENIYALLVDGSKLLVQETLEGSAKVKEWGKCKP